MMRIREGVTASVNASMDAVDANVLEADGLLLRTCEHGIRHPVGHLHRDLYFAQHEGEYGDERRHYVQTEHAGLDSRVACDGCCAPWLLGSAVTAVDKVRA
jgi:hypothetical protein